jgi:hypothetical protein
VRVFIKTNLPPDVAVTNLKPDIVIVDKQKKAVSILKLTCPAEHRINGQVQP